MNQSSTQTFFQYIELLQSIKQNQVYQQLDIDMQKRNLDFLGINKEIDEQILELQEKIKQQEKFVLKKQQKTDYSDISNEIKTQEFKLHQQEQKLSNQNEIIKQLRSQIQQLEEENSDMEQQHLNEVKKLQLKQQQQLFIIKRLQQFS